MDVFVGGPGPPDMNEELINLAYKSKGEKK